jgi:hypothetical protein
MGINDNRYYINSLRFSAKAIYNPQTDSLLLPDTQNANRMLNALRIGGYDASVIDPHTGIKHWNWAANSNGQVMPMLVSNMDFPINYILPCHTLRRRQRSWMNLGWMTRGVTIEVSMEPKGYVAYVSGERIVTRGAPYVPIVRVPKPFAESQAATFVITTNDGRLNYQYADFSLAERDVPPDRTERSAAPVATKVLLSTEAAIEGDGQTGMMEPMHEDETGEI